MSKRKKAPPDSQPGWNAQSVECPRCGSKAGEPCRNYKGQPRAACRRRAEALKCPTPSVEQLQADRAAKKKRRAAAAEAQPDLPGLFAPLYDLHPEAPL